MKRVNILEEAPEAYKAMRSLEEYLAHTQLTPIELELVKLRASQMNGCAFCLNMHTRDALKHGERVQRIVVLPGWRETDLFSESERALLALTEEVTLIHQGGVSEETYRQAEVVFGREKLAQIIMAIVTINGWNRIAITAHAPVKKEVYETTGG